MSDIPDVVDTLDHIEAVLDTSVVARVVGANRDRAAESETFGVRLSSVTWHRSKRSAEQLGSSSP